jgi:mannose-6-phosphate isomerase-like protein (cupin superfamily)
MENPLMLIAQRIAALREIADMTAQTVAEELGIPLETYRQYERGEADIPVSVLYSLAQRFNVELTALLTGDGPRLHGYCLVRRGKGVSVERRKDYAYQHLAFNFAHKKAEPFLVTVPPSNDALALNSHPGQEFTYVLSGTLRVMVDGHALELNPGDSVFFDSGQPHGMAALGSEPAEFLAMVM